MASLVRYSHCRYWIAAFRDASGRQCRQSTREVDKRRAQSVADQYERIAKRKGNPQHVREVFSRFYREHYNQDLPSASVRIYAKRWLDAHERELGGATYQHYKRTFEKFLEFLGPDAERDLTEITKARIAQFRDTQGASGLAGSTANKQLKIVKMLFRAARLDGLLWQDPAEGVKPLKGAQERANRRAFTLPEVSSILEIADDEWRSLIKCGLYTGQRLGDIARLCWNQIDFEKDEIRITTEKTKKRLAIPMATALREHLLALAGTDAAADAPVHPSAYAMVKAKGNVSPLSAQFAALLKTAGLRADEDGQTPAKGLDITFHSLRHTSVSLLKEAGIPDATVMALIGHDALRQSDHYTHVGKAALEKAARALPKKL
jgi:integrase